MKKNIIKSIILVAGMVFGQVSAQQLPMFSQFMKNEFVLNPALAGMDNEFAPLRIFARTQWSGLQYAPRTQTLSYNNSFMDDKMGLGGYLLNDRFGPISKTGINGTYSYMIQTGKDGKLSFGLGAMFYRFHLNTDSLVWDSKGNTDPVLYSQNNNFKTYVPNASFGIMYRTEKFWAGLALPELIPLKISSNDSNYVVQQRNHIFFNAGYRLMLAEEVFLEPSLFIKQVSGAPTQLDFNTNLRIKNSFNIGASFRTGDAVAVMAGYNMKTGYVIGYSYDFIISGLSQYTGGNHEIMVGYNFAKKKAPKENTGDGPMEDQPLKDNSKEEK